MADENEDTLGFSTTAPTDVDISDEFQDFRILGSLSFAGADMPKIPKRGMKDFEPHATNLQESILEASRSAMHAALSTPRAHAPKSHLVAIYEPATNRAYVPNPKGMLFRTMGSAKGGRTYLLPEEALHALERGSLDIRWPLSKDDETTEGRAEIDLGVPMSLQGAYAAFIGMERSEGIGLTSEMYYVYAYLKRSGYIVIRAGDWGEPKLILDSSAKEKPPTRNLGLLGWLFSRRAKTESPDRVLRGPLVAPGIYRTYIEVFELLSVIPSHDQSEPPSFSTGADPLDPFRVVFYVYKPDAQFKKSDPGLPHYRVAVVNARETPVPTLTQLSDLFATLPYDPPQDNAQLYQKLKHGHRSVVLAVVDQGVVSFLRFADAGFQYEKVYNRRGPASKRGGRGGRGRGRGRGR